MRIKQYTRALYTLYEYDDGFTIEPHIGNVRAIHTFGKDSWADMCIEWQDGQQTDTMSVYELYSMIIELLECSTDSRTEKELFEASRWLLEMEAMLWHK